MFTPVIVTIPLVLPLVMPLATRDCQLGRMGDPAADAQAITAFEARVNAYVDLHRRLGRPWPPMWLGGDFEQVEVAVDVLRRSLRAARPLAAQGEFFTPAVSDVFRFRVGKALRETDYDLQAMISATDGEDGAETWERPVVNEPLRVGGFDVTWAFFDVLPLLPLELEYRIVGRDLVLLDVAANMVVDVLDLAIPAYASVPAEKPWAPSDRESISKEEENRVVPLGDEFIGCLYGEGPEFRETEEDIPENVN